MAHRQTRALLGAISLAALVQSEPLRAQSVPGSFVTGIRVDDSGRQLGTIAPDPDGSGPLHFQATRLTYNSKGLLARKEVGELSQWQSDSIAPANWAGFTVYSQIDYAYDALGRRSRETVSGGGTVFSIKDFSYDILGRTLCTAVRMNIPATPASADACVQVAAGQYGPDRITKNVYDSADELVQVRKAVGSGLEQAAVTYTYTPNGKRQDTIDADGNRSRFLYDGHDRRRQWLFSSPVKPTSFDGSTPASAVATAGAVNNSDYELYGYDNNDNRTSLRKRDGGVIGYTYDARNQLILKDLPFGSDVSYSYDPQGHQRTAVFADTGLGITNTFDGFGQLTTSLSNVNGPAQTLQYQYDLDGNRTQLTFPDGQIFTYAYDGMDRQSDILQGSSTLLSFSYDPLGRRTSVTRQGAGTTTYGYDGASRLQTLAHDLAGSANDQTFSFTYNPSSQMISKGSTNDLYAFTRLYSVNRAYSSNGLNQYSAAGSGSFTYDANGNLKTDTGPAGQTTFSYDPENRLTSASGLIAATLNYDPMGRLTAISGSGGTTRLLYDGDDLVAEYNNSGTLVRRYLHGPGTDEPLIQYEGTDLSRERLLQADQQGSVIAITDNVGSAITLNRYDEYGIPQSTNSGRFQYTGQQWLPELGMYYYKARIYSPTLGRFLQTDPVGYEDQINLYEYASDDPSNHADPTGRYEKDVHYFLTFALARAAGLSPAIATRIAAADQGVDDNPATSPMGMSPVGPDVAKRAQYHFTTEARRVELRETFKKSGKASDLGVYLHAEQDSYSHAGYTPRFGHFFAGHAPDKTYNDVAKADKMAEDTFKTIEAAKSKLGENGAAVSYGDISSAVHQFNSATTAAAKSAALDQILRIGDPNRLTK